jgi:hypothetical protein
VCQEYTGVSFVERGADPKRRTLLSSHNSGVTFLSCYLRVAKPLLSSLSKTKTRGNVPKLLLTGYKATPKLDLKTKTRSNVPKLRLKGYKAREHSTTA